LDRHNELYRACFPDGALINIGVSSMRRFSSRYTLLLATGICTATLLALPALVRGDEKPVTKIDPAATKTSARLQEIFAGDTPKTIAELKAMETHIQQLNKKIAAATVGVRVGAAMGSGVIVSESGVVLTAAHVNGKPGQDVVFIFPDGSIKKGKTMGMDRRVDGGMMKITDPGKYPFVERGSSKDLERGQWVVATGHPNGYQKGRRPVLRVGRVIESSRTTIVTDCKLVGGDSGGPLFDMDGKVVGIHSRISGPLVANMHVPVSTYDEDWERYALGESWGPVGRGGPFIGVEGDPDRDDARIVAVRRDSPAEKAGVKAGDIVVKFDGRKVTSFERLASLVSGKRPGATVRVEVMRNDKKVSLNLVVGRISR